MIKYLRRALTKRRIRGVVITGQSKPSEDRYPCGELYMLPGVGTVDLGDGQVLQARGIRIVPIRETTTEGEGS